LAGHRVWQGIDIEEIRVVQQHRARVLFQRDVEWLVMPSRHWTLNPSASSKRAR
jgi:hypothetical protein